MRNAEGARLSVGDLLLRLGLVLVLIFMLAPIVFVVINSFSSVAYSVFPPPGFSLRWYVNLFTAVDFFPALRNSLFVAFASSLLSVSAGTLAGLALTRHRIAARELVRAGFLAPFIMPKIALGLAFFIIFLKLGLFGGAGSLILAHALLTLPFATAIMSANFVAVPRVVDEAAMDLGAGPVRTFLTVTLPQARAGLVVSFLFAFITSFDEVETSLFLVRSSNMTIPIELLNYMERWQDPTIAALSTLLIGISVVTVFVGVLLLRGTDATRVLMSGDRPKVG